jgi:hypothetical protein
MCIDIDTHNAQCILSIVSTLTYEKQQLTIIIVIIQVIHV